MRSTIHSKGSGPQYQGEKWIGKYFVCAWPCLCFGFWVFWKVDRSTNSRFCFVETCFGGNTNGSFGYFCCDGSKRNIFAISRRQRHHMLSLRKSGCRDLPLCVLQQRGPHSFHKMTAESTSHIFPTGNRIQSNDPQIALQTTNQKPTP